MSGTQCHGTQCLHLSEGENKTSWDVWTGYGDVTATLLGLSTGAKDVSYEDVAVLEAWNASQSCFMTAQPA